MLKRGAEALVPASGLARSALGGDDDDGPVSRIRWRTSPDNWEHRYTRSQICYDIFKSWFPFSGAYLGK